MKIEIMFGGKTRLAVLEALADATGNITAYQIAIRKGLDPAATYRCLADLLELGIVMSRAKGSNQTFYKLSKGPGQAAAAFLKSLRKNRPQVTDLEIWMSPSMRSERMAKFVRLKSIAPKFANPKEESVAKLLSKRTPGELSALIKSSKIAFDELFKQKGKTFVLRESR